MESTTNCTPVPNHLKRIGLEFNPFPVTPDASYYFVSNKVERNLTELLHCIEARKGFMLVTGDVGKGKTTLSRRLISLLKGDGTQVSLVFNSFLHGESLLEAINHDFGIPREEGIGAQLQALNNYLLGLYHKGSNCVIVIDDAQHLDVQSLELVRQISNLETNQAKLVQIILIAQPEILNTLDFSEIRQLKSRIALHVKLEAFTQLEVQDYISYRLSAAGHCGRIKITRPALKMLTEASSGIPRRINLIMDRCLYILSVSTRSKITEQDINAAVEDIGWSISKARHPYRLLVLGAVFVLAAGFWLVPQIDKEGELTKRAKSLVNQIFISEDERRAPAKISLATPKVETVAPAPSIADSALSSVASSPVESTELVKSDSTPIAEQAVEITSEISEPIIPESTSSDVKGGGEVDAINDQAARDFLALYHLEDKYDLFVEAVYSDFFPLFERDLQSTSWKLIISEFPLRSDQVSAAVYVTPESLGPKRWVFLWEPSYKLDTWEYGKYSDEVSKLQEALASQGFYQSKIDGVVGSVTKVAIARFQKSIGLPPTGEPDLLTLSQLAVTENNNIQNSMVEVE